MNTLYSWKATLYCPTTTSGESLLSLNSSVATVSSQKSKPVELNHRLMRENPLCADLVSEMHGNFPPSHPLKHSGKMVKERCRLQVTMFTSCKPYCKGSSLRPGWSCLLGPASILEARFGSQRSSCLVSNSLWDLQSPNRQCLGGETRPRGSPKESAQLASSRCPLSELTGPMHERLSRSPVSRGLEWGHRRPCAPGGCISTSLIASPLHTLGAHVDSEGFQFSEFNICLFVCCLFSLIRM